MRVAEIKHMIGDKVKSLRRRESAEQFDLDSVSQKSLRGVADDASSSGRASPDNDPRPALTELTENDNQQQEQEKKTKPWANEEENEKLDEDDSGNEEEEEIASSCSSSDPLTHQHEAKQILKRRQCEEEELSSCGSEAVVQKPIITITQHSPNPSPAHSKQSHAPPTPPATSAATTSAAATSAMMEVEQQQQGSCREDSNCSDDIMSDVTSHDSLPILLHRSATDSCIKYNKNEEVEEVPGSVYYIQSNGQLNYLVILQAIHAVAKRPTTARVTGVILNILNCLMDLHVIHDNKVLTDTTCMLTLSPILS